MTYDSGSSGRAGDHPSGCGRVELGDDFWTFAAVEERLVEAMRHWWRAPDRDRSFGLAGRISSIWRMSLDDPLALIERHGLVTPEPRPLPLSRMDMARMAEASEWLAYVPERDRLLVIAALRCLARGDSQVPWLKLKHRLGIKFGADGLRMRYGRAITCIAHALNVAEIRVDVVSR